MRPYLDTLDEFVRIGKIVRPHGVHGEVKVLSLSSATRLFKAGYSVVIADEKEEKAFTVVIKSVRPVPRGFLLKIEGIETPELARKVSGMYIYVKKDELPKLSEGEFYYYQLIGGTVVDERGEVGKVEDIVETGAVDVLVVRTLKGEEKLIPLAREFIEELDLEKGIIRVVGEKIR
ncbi:MAG: 16S rRNA processing protein RimM [Thermotogae bacterium]|nr:16S rRNA processing protein RimM [Thermotogota bacterium]